MRNTFTSEYFYTVVLLLLIKYKMWVFPHLQLLPSVFILRRPHAPPPHWSPDRFNQKIIFLFSVLSEQSWGELASNTQKISLTSCFLLLLLEKFMFLTLIKLLNSI